MNYSERALLVTAVGDDRTIVLPASIPRGATIGIVVLSNPPTSEASRKARFKAALAEAVNAFLAPLQTRIKNYLDDEKTLLAILDEGAVKTNRIAEEKMEVVREKIGVKI